MTLLLFLFYLVLLPRESLVCSLWVAQPPTPEQISAACGPVDLDKLTVKIINIQNGALWCEKNGSAVYAPDIACDLKGISLDNFRLEVYRADPETALCSVTTPNNPPQLADIRAACPPEAIEAYLAGRAVIRYIDQVEPAPTPAPAPVALPVGPGLYDQPAAAADLATQTAYSWLAGRLIWYGYVTPDCDGYSGLDPLSLHANGCGMQAAAPLVLEWQNRFDAEIYAAALAANVPARLLKRIIAAESQFWPWPAGQAGEIGLAQITPAAADQYLRLYSPGYYQLQPEQRAALQHALIARARCDYCTIEEAIQKERENIQLYARMLAAYRLTAPDWYGALVAWNGEAYAQKVSG